MQVRLAYKPLERHVCGSEGPLLRAERIDDRLPSSPLGLRRASELINVTERRKKKYYEIRDAGCGRGNGQPIRRPAQRSARDQKSGRAMSKEGYRPRHTVRQRARCE